MRNLVKQNSNQIKQIYHIGLIDDESKKLNEDNFDLDYYILYEAPREWILKTGSSYFDKLIINKIYNTKRCVINKKYTQPILIERSKHFLKCPMCNSLLVERNGKNGKFYSCSKYPKCKFSKKRLYDIGLTI